MSKFDFYKPVVGTRLYLDSNNLNNSEGESALFGRSNSQSFNGFCGTSEFESFPIRQLFFRNYGIFPSEWDTGYFNKEDIDSYINEHKQDVVAIHYLKNKGIRRCLLHIEQDQEPVYIYIHDRSYGNSINKYAVSLLFKSKTDFVEKLIDYFISIVIPENDNEGYLNILVKSNGDFDLQPKKINCPDIDFDLNYNEDFLPIHNLIIDRLSVENSKGLVMLHGLAGTGKTNYIRYLINNLKKRVIYIPPSMTDIIADPDLIKFFIRFSNSVLVIEDAENVLMKRVSNSSQAIANILNLTDGLLSDCVNIQIVATFNTDILNIDEALLRKGRLIAKYEFTELEENRALALSKKLGLCVNGRRTLADIYNSNDLSFSNKVNKIGF